MLDWSVTCHSCGKKFFELGDYALHMPMHPAKCNKCKLWFNELIDFVSHPCKRLAHEH